MTRQLMTLKRAAVVAAISTAGLCTYFGSGIVQRLKNSLFFNSELSGDPFAIEEEKRLARSAETRAKMLEDERIRIRMLEQRIRSYAHLDERVVEEQTGNTEASYSSGGQ